MVFQKGISIFFIITYFLYSSEKDTFLQVAEEYYFARKYSAALPYLEKVLSQDPENARAASLLGDILLFTGRYEEAMFYHRRAAELSPQNALEYYRLGQSALALKRGFDAENYFRRAYEIDPSLNRCLFQLGYISLVYQQDKEKTISYWRKFLARDPQDPQADKIEEVLLILEDPEFELPKGVTTEELARFLQGELTFKETEGINPKGKEAGHLNQKEIYEKKDLLLEED